MKTGFVLCVVEHFRDAITNTGITVMPQSQGSVTGIYTHILFFIHKEILAYKQEVL